MTLEIVLVFGILGLALLLFLTGWVRIDIVALLVMGTLGLTGLVSPREALAGFSNPAVITVWAMFILSAALYQTGVARIIGVHILRLAGEGEARLIVLVMLTAGLMSAFMNNIGVAALMLPVVMDMARSRNISPSRLLLPLAYATMLGGLTTLIGTPPNLLISHAMEDGGHTPFLFFDYTPIGISALFAGIIFMVFVGRFLLPKKDALTEINKIRRNVPGKSYGISERSFLLRVSQDSFLAGKTLQGSRLRRGLGLNVISITRDGQVIRSPDASEVLQTGDMLYVQGNEDVFRSMQHWEAILPEAEKISTESLLGQELMFFEVDLSEQSSLSGTRLQDTRFRKRLGINVIAVKRGTQIIRDMLHELLLQKGDTLLLQGPVDRIKKLREEGRVGTVRPADKDLLINQYNLHKSLFLIKVHGDAELLQESIAESHIGSAFGITVIGTLQDNNKLEPYSPKSEIHKDDWLLVKGNMDDLPIFQALMELEIIEKAGDRPLNIESDEVMLAEAILAPRSLLAGKTLREINFRQKYGLTVLAIWHEGEVHMNRIHNQPLKYGEALLVYGQREKLELLGKEEDFILLTEIGEQPRRTKKAKTAALIMAAMLLPVIVGIIPLANAAILGIALMVLSGCLKMEEAYRAIEWRAVFLIAGMLPLGTAMQETGAANVLAHWVGTLFGSMGPWGLIGGLYLITACLTIAIHPAAIVVIMSPVALELASTSGISPHTVMMAVAIAAAAVFMSPVSHAANLIVMGPGGYRFRDYLKVGIPMTLVVMLVTMLLLPIIWPL